jgi:hypothetical protein
MKLLDGGGVFGGLGACLAIGGMRMCQSHRTSDEPWGSPGSHLSRCARPPSVFDLRERGLRQVGVADSRLPPDARPFSIGREAQEAKALRMNREELGPLLWDTAALRRACTPAGRKVPLVADLRRQPTMSLKWIGQYLALGSRPHVSNLLRAWGQTGMFKK